jgi:hypothetical protein
MYWMIPIPNQFLVDPDLVLTLMVARLCGRLNISARAGTSDDMCDFNENVIKISTSIADRHPDFVRCSGTMRDNMISVANADRQQVLPPTVYLNLFFM